MKTKRRVIKKWINRYITPEINNLPTTNYRGFEIKNVEVQEDGLFKIVIVEHVGENHTIVDGYKKREGDKAILDSNKLACCKRTAQLIRQIKATHRHVYVRMKPGLELWNKSIYMRLITERVNANA